MAVGFCCLSLYKRLGTLHVYGCFLCGLTSVNLERGCWEDLVGMGMVIMDFKFEKCSRYLTLAASTMFLA